MLAKRPSFQVGNSAVAWSPDGRSIASVSSATRDNATRRAVQIISAASGEVRDLYAFDAPARALAWLPDGSGLLVVGTNLQGARGQIYFVSYPKGEVSRFTNDLTNYDSCCLDVTRDGRALVALQNTVQSDLWVAKPDGSDAKQVTSGEPIGLGLDWVGNKILASGLRGQWSLLNSDGSGMAPFLDDREPHLQVSACGDGKHVVYTTYRQGAFEIWRTDPDGSNPKKLVPAVTALRAGGCAPDSQSVMYLNDRGVWRVPIEGGTPEKVDLPLAEQGFSPDGKLHFYFSQRVENGNWRGKLIVDTSDTHKQLAEFDVPYGMSNPRFTPDGKALAFLLTRKGATNIWMQRLTGGDPVPLTNFPSGDMFTFAWSKDGKQLAVSRGRLKSDVVMMSNFR